MAGTCKLCGEEITNYVRHMAASHPEANRENAGRAREGLANKRRKAAEKAASSGNGKGGGQVSAPAPTRKASSVAEANFISIVPKTFTISSTTLQVAKAVCEKEWGWPEMSMEDFLDTYIYETMKQRGILLGAWVTLPRNGAREETDGGEEYL